MAAITSHIPSLRRQIKNVACNYSDAQIKVREATSNDPWGASTSLMSEIANMTYNAMAFTEIMQMIWKRLNDHGKNWRHVYKSLVLLDYLIKVGSEKVTNQCRENIFVIQTLKDFQHVEDNKDQGMNVREKAKQLVAILKDEDRLKNERTKALLAQKRFVQNDGDSSLNANHRRLDSCRSDNDLTTYSHNLSSINHRTSTLPSPYALNNGRTKSSFDIRTNVHRRDSELEECRPSSAGEEELQLQIALAISKEEADKEVETKKHDDMRFQMALQASKGENRRIVTGQIKNVTLASPGQSTSTAKQTSALDDLLSLNQDGLTHNNPWNDDEHQNDELTHSNSKDPWGASVSSSPPCDKFDFSGSSHQDPFSVTGDTATSSKGPWLADIDSKDALGQYTSTAANAVDPWGSDILSPNVTNSIQNQTSSSQQTYITDAVPKDGRKLKTPDTFLGENSGLVNLDNLMNGASSKTMTSTVSQATFAQLATNPFAVNSSGNPALVVNANSTNNPFFVHQKRATPTLNEMRGGTVNGSGVQYGTAGSTAWSSGEQASNNNPFL